MDSANGGRVSSQLTQEACSVFQEAISLILSRWTALQMALENEWGGRDSQNKYDQLAADIFSWFTRSKEAMYIDDLENILDESMVLSFNTELEDGSIEEVAEQLMSIHEGCLQGSYEAIERLQDRNGTSRRAMWIVEFVEGTSVIRLKSCYGKYLAASNVPFLLGMTGKKVLQILPRRLDSSVEWEPIRDGFQVKFKTRYGNFLRANGGLPPWRNSITHDIPHRTATQDWILWDVDVVDIQVQSASHESKSAASEPCSPSMLSIKSPRFARLESRDSFVGSPIKADGRTIHYKIADDNGDVDDAINPSFFTFKGNEVDELTHKLEEETGLQNILVCSRNPLNGNLYPLRLHLPPNNTTMHVVVLPPSARVVKESGQTGKSVVE